MKSLTLHALDDQLANLLKNRANEMSISMNELAKRLLAESLGIKTSVKPPHRDEFAPYCGTWTEADVTEFERAVSNLEEVDEGDWQ